MTTAEFYLSLIALLLAPGPTNTLLALAGAERGAWRALALTPAVAAGYMAAVLPLTFAGAGLMEGHATLSLAVTFAAAAWVAWLAASLWRLPAARDADIEGPGGLRLFTTTLLNPKGLIIGLVMLPSQDRLAIPLLAFLLVLILVSAGWALAGSLIGRAPGGKRGRGAQLFRRACAGWLGVLSLWLAAGGLA
ncbi:hypothetical protein [Aestuariivirga sp.]|uniref:hypothetical protein n=1 Tax=Aestuariivirga sp. TaxID=2650926 RepID=UPI00391D1E3B